MQGLLFLLEFQMKKNKLQVLSEIRFNISTRKRQLEEHLKLLNSNKKIGTKLRSQRIPKIYKSILEPLEYPRLSNEIIIIFKSF